MSSYRDRRYHVICKECGYIRFGSNHLTVAAFADFLMGDYGLGGIVRLNGEYKASRPCPKCGTTDVCLKDSYK
jgi:predicted nucleic-acid-binding Zn-ribbon protein